ncbi:MAG: hypothetical protein H7A24_11790 [Leptospiraceae bacterium]|nr:hypothetical protein [Leptospiraceae bacterium]MCP5512555.1 hypothetical protein [Leptospiraceae bacterium]
MRISFPNSNEKDQELYKIDTEKIQTLHFFLPIFINDLDCTGRSVG